MLYKKNNDIILKILYYYFFYMWFWEWQYYAYNKPETNDYSDTTWSLNNLKNELTLKQAQELKQKSIDKVQKFEVFDFIRIQKEFFWKNLDSEIDFVNEVKKIQSESGLPETWIIDEETLKAIYLNVYQYKDELIQDSRFYFVRDKILRYLKADISSEETIETQEKTNPWKIQESSPKISKTETTDEPNEDFNQFLKQRESEIKWEMKGEFRSNFLLVRNYFASSKKFNNEPIGSENTKFISKGIDRSLFKNDNPKEHNKYWNSIFISKLAWKVVLRFYINSELHLSTIVSPWKEKPTKDDFYSWKHTTDIYHKSNLYPTLEENQKKWINKVWWAIMPYAVFLADWIYVHWSDSPIDWNYQSHGCIRTPTYYAKEIFDKVNEIQSSGETVTIDTRWIY